MNLDGSAVLHADPERVWSVITDPAVLARTIPGVETLEQVGDDEYKMNVTVGVGAIRGTYAGEAGVIPGTAAIASAIEDAVGRRIASMPLSPSELYDLVRNPDSEMTATAGRRAGTGAMA